MFLNLTNITSLDLSGFITNNVIDFNAFIGDCPNIEELNLCSFNTSSAKDMQRMFSGMTSLKIIYVGPNWTTINADTTGMFDSSGISEVTTGQCQ